MVEDPAFPDKLIKNEEAVIQLKITPTTPYEDDSIELPVLGDKTNNLKVNDKKDPQGHTLLPVSPESYSSSEEELKDIQKASESFLKETVTELAYSKEAVCSHNYSSSEDFANLKQTSVNKDLLTTHPQSYMSKQIGENDHQILQDVSDEDPGGTDHEAERTIKQVSVPEEIADSCLLSHEQESLAVQASPVYKTIQTSLLNDNKKEETEDLNSTRAISHNVSQILEEESLAEDMTKDGGSSSKQGSETTSPTSLSSLGEESDSSPCHKKDSLEGKQQRKVKHRQGQTFQTNADSSEEEEILEEDQLIEQETEQKHFKKSYKKSNKVKDKLLDYPLNNYSQKESISQTDEVLQISGKKMYEPFSYSNILPDSESEQENIISHRPMDATHDVEVKQLKSADEVYEEIMLKAQELKGMTKKITPPEIEPLYGGMRIEDYVYESLVEEPAQAIAIDHNTSVDEYLTNVSLPEAVRKLRTPDEAYEEMQKNRELIIKDQTTECAQTNKSPPYGNTTLTSVTDTCYVDILENYEFTKQQDENWQWYAETANDELLNSEKEVMTPETSRTQSTSLSPVSPLSLSEPLTDSAEVIQIPSSGEEDNDKGEFATEPIECAMEPYRSESTSPQDQPVKNVLYTIPDLKIIQCSSCEEEAEDEKSITQEYETEMLNGIAQDDDRSEKALTFIGFSVEVQSVESEPTSVVSEVPLSKPTLGHVSLTSSWDSQASPLSLPSTALGLTAVPPCIFDETEGQAFITAKTLESDSAHVIISIADLVSKPATQNLAQSTSLIDISTEEILSHAAESTNQTITVSTTPRLPGMPVTDPPLTPKQTVGFSPADTAVSESSLTLEPTQAPKPVDVLTCKPPLTLKPVFTSKPTSDAIIVTVQDGISQPDSVLQAHSILESTTIADYSTPIPTSAVTTVSTHEQITASQAVSPISVLATMSYIPDFATAPAYESQAPIPCVTSTPFVHDVVFPTSEHPNRVPSLDATPRYTEKELISSIVPEPVTFIVEMPDLISSPSQYPIHSASVLSSLTHTSASTLDYKLVNSPTAVSTCCSTKTLTTVQSISAPCGPCSAVSEPTKPGAPTSLAANMTSMTSAIKISIPFIEDNKSHVEATAAYELPVTFSQTSQSTQHVATKVLPTKNTIVALPTPSSQTSALQTRQSNTIILPNVENVPLIKQETQEIITNTMETFVQQVRNPPVASSVTPIINAHASSPVGLKASLSSDLTFVSTHYEPQVAAISRERVDKPVIVFPPPPAVSPPALPPYTSFNLQSVIPTTTETVRSIASETPKETVKQVAIHKPPPPVPPKPFCPPGSLVFSHKSRESTRQSILPESAVIQVGHAATLPRTREPPKALTLSLTAPSDIKHSLSSPKSPLSPRFAKTLETYVVITLPSEPGSPVEGVTTQAPTQRPSLSTPLHQDLTVVSTRFTATGVSAPQTIISQPGVPIPPKVSSTSFVTAPVIGNSAPDIINKAAIHSASTMISTDVTVTPVSSMASVTQSVAASLAIVPQTKTSILPIKVNEEKNIYRALPVATTMYPAPTSQVKYVTSHVLVEIPDKIIEPKIKTLSTGISASVSNLVLVPNFEATNLDFVPQNGTVKEPSIKETCEEKSINSAPPVTTTIYPAPTVVSIPTIASPVVSENLNITVEPNRNTVSTMISVSESSVVLASSPSFVPQIETDSVIPEKEIYKEISIYPALPVNTAVCPAATEVCTKSPDTLLAVSVVAEIPAILIETKTNNMSAVVSATEVCATHMSAPQTESPSVVTGTLPAEEIPVELAPAVVTEDITPTSLRASVVSHDVMQGLERQSLQTVYPAPTITKLPLSQIVFESQKTMPSLSALTYIPTGKVPFVQLKKSVESQERRKSGPAEVLSSMSQLYSTIATTEQHPYALPSLLAQVVTTEVQRTTTVSVVHEGIPLDPNSDSACRQATLKQNGKIHCIDDVIDLSKLKAGVSITEKGMDLTIPESNVQSFLNDSSSRQITAVQPEIVNLSAEITPVTTFSVVTDGITVVTCTATLAYNNNITVDTSTNLQSVTSMPLAVSTYKPFEPLAQIVYRPVNLQPKTTTSTEIPINLSCGPAETTASSSLPVSITPVVYTPSSIPIHIEPSTAEAIDLTISKQKRTMLALNTSTGMVTSVVEEDVAPVDLTAGRRAVCCDIFYRLPFTGSCRTQPPVTSTDKNLRPEDFGHIKTLGFGSNLTQSDLVTKNGFVSQNDAPDVAIDLTSAKMSKGQYYSACVL